MKLVRGVLILVLLVLIGLFGFSYMRNPDLSPSMHASAVGFAFTNPLSSRAWRGLACPHRSVVTDLVTKSVAPKLCGSASDGGAAERAERFRTEGPTSCWALYDALKENILKRFADVIASQKSSPASADFCRRAEALIKQHKS